MFDHSLPICALLDNNRVWVWCAGLFLLTLMGVLFRKLSIFTGLWLSLVWLYAPMMQYALLTSTSQVREAAMTLSIFTLVIGISSAWLHKVSYDKALLVCGSVIVCLGIMGYWFRDSGLRCVLPASGAIQNLYANLYTVLLGDFCRVIIVCLLLALPALRWVKDFSLRRGVLFSAMLFLVISISANINSALGGFPTSMLSYLWLYFLMIASGVFAVKSLMERKVKPMRLVIIAGFTSLLIGVELFYGDLVQYNRPTILLSIQ